MASFAFVIHPLSPRDAARKYPIAAKIPEPILEFGLRHLKPMVASRVTGIRSIAGPETDGWFIACPLTPKLMTEKLPLETVYRRIVRCAEIAAEQGAKIIGLGAFTSVVGDGGVTIAQRSPIPVTTGNSYTVATAIEGTLKACEMLEADPAGMVLAIVGATGSIGKTCARILGPKFSRTILIGRDLDRTRELEAEVPNATATNQILAAREADVIITVTSSDAAVLLPEHLKPGCIVCDVARPRDVSVRVSKERPDVLVIEGGVVEVPGDVKFGIDFGFPERTAYACMSETILLALEDRLENFTLGKDVSVEQVQEMWRLAAKHGFRLAGFRSFEKAVTEDSIERARRARKTLGAAVPRTVSA